MIDLRSDTITKPTPAMRKAMAEAEVGDDVYGEDPTVNRLERRAAEIFAKEAALFVPTGTMGNTIAIKLLTDHGQEVICDSRSHVMDWELAMTAWFSGCFARPIETSDGILTWDRIAPFVRERSAFWAPTGAITLENTHNMHGGIIYPLDVIDEVCRQAQHRGLPVHMDGARIFNASAELGVPVSRIAAGADTVMFCLSKGLAAPAGSILLGNENSIARGRLYRKRLGGAMRQAGILAAAGLIALEEMPLRLAEDHAKARRMAQFLKGIDSVRVAPVMTNIVVIDLAQTGMTPPHFISRVKERGVLINTAGGTRVRALTHLDVSMEQCEAAAATIAEALLAPVV
jgi:threonine aldolase